MTFSIKFTIGPDGKPKRAVGTAQVPGSIITKMTQAFPKEEDDKPTLRIVPTEPEPEPDDAA